jgi:alkanesulfonate monooxygenase SsuD/methylene tetrahydromethanopterin reductase-like flavin-dependent oxidoreductase (luciferase family)
MTTLAALATATSRVRLGLLVTGVTYRHPSVLTAEAITVDHAHQPGGSRLQAVLLEQA